MRGGRGCSSVGRHTSARNDLIVSQRADGWPLAKIASEHGLSMARVSKILQDRAKDLRIAELEAEVARLRAAIERGMPLIDAYFRQQGEAWQEARARSGATIDWDHL
jgi:hypothetical protein